MDLIPVREDIEAISVRPVGDALIILGGCLEDFVRKVYVGVLAGDVHDKSVIALVHEPQEIGIAASSRQLQPIDEIAAALQPHISIQETSGAVSSDELGVALGHDGESLSGALESSSKSLAIQAVGTIVPHRLVRAAVINEGNAPIADPIRRLDASAVGPQQAYSFKCRKLQINDDLNLSVLTNAFVVCSDPVGLGREHNARFDRTPVRREASRK